MGLRSWGRKRRFARVLKTATVVAYEGLKVPVSGAHMTRQNFEAIYNGAYEQPEIKAVRALTRPGDRVLELGMGIGIVTGIAAKAVGPSGRVVTFEANPQLLGAAEDLFNINGLKNVDIRKGVLGVDAGVTSATFYLADHYTESGLNAAHGRTQQLEVPVTFLDTVVAEVRPDVLVCDIEGAEADLVPAMDFSGCRAAIIELHPAVLSRSAVAAIYRHLAKHDLFPRIELSSGTVVAFERVDPAR